MRLLTPPPSRAVLVVTRWHRGSFRARGAHRNRNPPAQFSYILQFRRLGLLQPPRTISDLLVLGGLGEVLGPPSTRNGPKSPKRWIFGFGGILLVESGCCRLGRAGMGSGQGVKKIHKILIFLFFASKNVFSSKRFWPLLGVGALGDGL